MRMRKVAALLVAVTVLLNAWIGIGMVVKAADFISDEIYVSIAEGLNGNGTFGSPFTSLEAARDYIRKLRTQGYKLPDGGVTVFLRGGTYMLDKSFELTDKDGGEEGKPIVYKSYDGETAVLVGGAVLGGSDFRKVDNDIINSRLRRNAKGKVYHINLKELGYSYSEDLSNPPSVELFMNGAAMSLARYPNSGYMLTGTVVDPGSIPRNTLNDRIGTKDYIPPEQYVDRGAIWKYIDPRHEYWASASDMWIYGMLKYNWAVQRLPVEYIKPSTGEIKTLKPHTYGVDPSKEYYVYNVLEEIDLPGEYFINRKNGDIYMFPIDDMENSEIIITLLEKPLFDIDGAKNITLSSLKLQGVISQAVSIKNCEEVLVVNCDISQTYKNAVSISKSKNTGVVSSKIYDVGAGGVFVEGGDRQTLEPANNFAVNNHVFRFQRVDSNYTSAVSLSGVGNRAAFNEMNDAAHLAMQFSGNDHVIEYNEIHDVLKEMDDMGAIYSGREWTWRGTKIYNNYFHNLYPQIANVHLGAQAIYLDDGMSGIDVRYNVFADSTRAYWLNGGRNNDFMHNLVINQELGIYSDIMNWSPLTPNSTILVRLTQVPYQSSAYSKYPNLANILDDEPQLPKYNNIVGNALVNSKGFSSSQLRTVTLDDLKVLGKIENNVSYTGNPGFANYEMKDYSLKPDSKILQDLPELANIKFDRFGTYTSKVDELMSDIAALCVNSPNAYVNNKKTLADPENRRVKPFIYQGSTLIPVRMVSESFGGETSWDEATKTITINIDGRVVKMNEGSNEMIVDNEKVKLDVPAMISDGRTYIPLRAFVEKALGKKLLWDNRGLILIGDNVLELDKEENRDYISEMFFRVKYY